MHTPYYYVGILITFVEVGIELLTTEGLFFIKIEILSDNV